MYIINIYNVVAIVSLCKMYKDSKKNMCQLIFGGSNNCNIQVYTHKYLGLINNQSAFNTLYISKYGNKEPTIYFIL